MFISQMSFLFINTVVPLTPVKSMAGMRDLLVTAGL